MKVIKMIVFYVYHVFVFGFVAVVGALRSAMYVSPVIVGLHNLSLVLAAFAAYVAIFGGFYDKIKELSSKGKEGFVNLIDKFKKELAKCKDRIKGELDNFSRQLKKMEDWFLETFYYADLKAMWQKKKNPLTEPVSLSLRRDVDENNSFLAWKTRGINKNAGQRSVASQPTPALLEKERIFYPLKIFGIAILCLTEGILLFWLSYEFWDRVNESWGIPKWWITPLSFFTTVGFESLVIFVGALALESVKTIFASSGEDSSGSRAGAWARTLVFGAFFAALAVTEVILVMVRIELLQEGANLTETYKILIKMKPLFYFLALGTVLLLAYYGNEILSAWKWKRLQTVQIKQEQKLFSKCFLGLFYLLSTLIIFIPLRISCFIIKIPAGMLAYLCILLLSVISFLPYPLWWVVGILVFFLDVLCGIAYALFIPFGFLWPLKYLPQMQKNKSGDENYSSKVKKPVSSEVERSV